MTAAYDQWRDDLMDLTDDVFLARYGQSKQGTWQKLMGHDRRVEVVPVDEHGFPVQVAPEGVTDDDFRHGESREALR